MSQDSAGILWLATPNGLYSLDPAAGTIQHYAHNPDDPSSLSNNLIKSSAEDKEGRFWVATIGYLDEFDRRTGKVTRHHPVPGTPAGFGFYKDRFGAFWIFHDAPNPLSVFDPGDEHAHQLFLSRAGAVHRAFDGHHGNDRRPGRHPVACHTRGWFT